MRKELDDYLVKRYPQLFKERNASRRESCMAYGFQCGDGWFNLLNMLCESINNHIKNLKRNNDFNQKQLDLALVGKLDEMHDWMRKSYEEGNLVIQEIPEVSVVEVKEKFGLLRFSVTGADDSIRGMISMANSMSSNICEECGKPGKLSSTTTGWIRVLCNEHNPRKKTELEIQSKVEVLIDGDLITLEVVKIINPKEFVGLKLNEWMRADPKDKNKLPEYFVAKYIENDIKSYWDAEPTESK